MRSCERCSLINPDSAVVCDCGFPLGSEGLGRTTGARASTSYAAPGQQSERSYFSRHFRGELPLWVSFWINLVLLGSVLKGCSTAIYEHSIATSSYRALWILGVTVFLLTAVNVWQVVGTWRSASRVTSLWGGLAHISLVGHVLRSAGALFVGEVPVTLSYVWHATQEAADLTWQIRVLRDGTAVELTGGIGPGFARDLERTLASQPRIELVHVNLERGGLISEAELAQRALQRRKLSTYVSNACVSACTLVFLGGSARLLKRGAKLGFHAVRMPGATHKAPESVLAEARAHMVGAGIAPEFAARAMETPPDTLWFPDAAELEAAGVITAVTDGNDLSLTTGASPPDIETAAAWLEHIRTYQVIKARHPEQYDEIVRAVSRLMTEGRSMNELTAVVRPIVTTLLVRALPRASDAAVLRYGDLMRRQGRELLAAPIEACARLFEGPPSQELVPYLEKLGDEELEAMADVIESAAQPEPNIQATGPLETRRLLDRALRDGRILVSQGERPPGLNDSRMDDPEDPCAVTFLLHTGLAQLPTRTRARLLRTMLTTAATTR